MKSILPKLTPKQKKIIDIVVTSLEVIVVLIAIIASAIIISNPNPVSANVSKGSVKLLPVLSGSMDGDYKDSFKKGDLVIAGNPKNVLQLKEGDIITFKGSEGGYDILITHRIVEVIKDDDGVNARTYITRGDANPENQTETVNPYEVLAVYKSHLKGVGNTITWLQQPKHFLLVIILPLALLFIWNIIIFVRMIIQWKMEKAAANGGAIDEEEIKRKAIEEYLASQNGAKDKEETDVENKEDGEENKEENSTNNKDDITAENVTDSDDNNGENKEAEKENNEENKDTEETEA